MLYSKLFGKTLKTNSKKAEAISHQYLVRGGFIDQHEMAQDRYSLVTDSALSRSPTAAPSPAFGLHHSLPRTAVGGLHRCRERELLTAGGRCNRSELRNELPSLLTACCAPLTSSRLADRCNRAWGAGATSGMNCKLLSLVGRCAMRSTDHKTSW